MPYRVISLCSCLMLLLGCQPTNHVNTSNPDPWNPQKLEERRQNSESKALKSWWSFFNDPILDRLITSALSLSAQENSRTQTLPQGETSYEALRAIAQNRNAALAHVIAQDYAEYRYIQNMRDLLIRHIEDRQDVIKRAKGNENQIKILKAEHMALRKRESELKAQTSRLEARLAQHTKLLPEFITQVLKETHDIPHADITLLLASPASVMDGAGDVIAAQTAFIAEMEVAQTNALPSPFPDTTISSFFGIPDDAFLRVGTNWNVSVGKAIENMQLQILESHYAGKLPYQIFRDRLFSYVLDVERLIISYAHIGQQYAVLQAADDEAQKGAVPQDEAYKARLAVLRAHHEMTKTLIDLYKILDVY